MNKVFSSSWHSNSNPLRSALSAQQLQMSFYAPTTHQARYSTIGGLDESTPDDDKPNLLFAFVSGSLLINLDPEETPQIQKIRLRLIQSLADARNGLFPTSIVRESWHLPKAPSWIDRLGRTRLTANAVLHVTWETSQKTPHPVP